MGDDNREMLRANLSIDFGDHLLEIGVDNEENESTMGSTQLRTAYVQQVYLVSSNELSDLLSKTRAAFFCLNTLLLVDSP